MNSLEDNFRQMIREEIRTAIGEGLSAILEQLAEIRNGTPAELRGMLTLDQVAEYLGVHQQTARAWCHKNKVKLHKIESTTRVMGEEVHSVLTRKK